MTLEQEKIHQVVELADRALHRVERLIPRRGVGKHYPFGHFERIEIRLQLGHVSWRPVLIVGEAGIVIGPHRAEMRTECFADVGTIQLEYADELTA